MEDNALVAKPKQWWAVTKEFATDTRSEMKKVTWPSRNEVVGTTVVVLVATIVFALYLWGVDILFSKGILFLFDKFGASA